MRRQQRTPTAFMCTPAVSKPSNTLHVAAICVRLGRVWPPLCDPKLQRSPQGSSHAGGAEDGWVVVAGPAPMAGAGDWRGPTGLPAAPDGAAPLAVGRAGGTGRRDWVLGRPRMRLPAKRLRCGTAGGRKGIGNRVPRRMALGVGHAGTRRTHPRHPRGVPPRAGVIWGA
jgi:hypothetical protein